MFRLASSNVTNIFEAKRSAILFASPGVISDSCNKTGTLFSHPQLRLVQIRNRLFEKITSGFSLRILTYASITPFITRKDLLYFSNQNNDVAFHSKYYSRECLPFL